MYTAEALLIHKISKDQSNYCFLGLLCHWVMLLSFSQCANWFLLEYIGY